MGKAGLIQEKFGSFGKRKEGDSKDISEEERIMSCTGTINVESLWFVFKDREQSGDLDFSRNCGHWDFSALFSCQNDFFCPPLKKQLGKTTVSFLFTFKCI